MSGDQDTAYIDHLFRHSYYQSAQVYCDIHQRRRPDSVLLFYKAVAYILIERPNEAIRSLVSLADKPELVLAVPAALIHAHKQCVNPDRESIDELDTRLTMISSSTANVNERSISILLSFLFHTRQHNEVHAWLVKSESMNAIGPSIQCLKGWLKLQSGSPVNDWDDTDHFSAVLSKYPSHIEATLGTICQLRRDPMQINAALDLSSKLIVKHPRFLPGYVERMFCIMDSVAWDQLAEAAQRVIALDADNIDALLVLCLFDFVRDGNIKSGKSRMTSLVKTINKYEPQNAQVTLFVVRIFNHLAGQQTSISDNLQLMIEKAIEISPHIPLCHVELGYINIQSGKFKQALQNFANASKADSQCIPAIEGSIQCEALLGKIDNVSKELEILNAIQVSTGKSITTMYLSALLAKQRHGQTRLQQQQHHHQSPLALLRETVQTAIDTASTLPLNLEYFALVNMRLLLNVARELVDLSPSEPIRQDDQIPETILVLQNLLDFLVSISPGSAEICYLQALCSYISRDQSTATKHITRCQQLDTGYYKIHILQAQIFLAQNQPQLALQSLETTLAQNFEVRGYISFHILKASALRQIGNINDALGSIKTVENMFDDVKAVAKKADLTSNDRLTYYLEYALIQSSLGNDADAIKYLKEARNAFTGTVFEDRITLAQADLAVHQCDFEQAISVLATIMPENMLYVQAKRRMGDIYLNNKKDKKAYTRCCNELTEHFPLVETYVALADAYLTVQEPESAINALNAGLMQFSDSSILAVKMGQALVKIHDFSQAVDYYESALSRVAPSEEPTLRFNLAQLYSRLSQFADAERVINQALDHAQTDNQLPVITADVKLLRMLAQNYRKERKIEKAIEVLLKASSFLSIINSRKMDTVNSRISHETTSDVYQELAELHIMLKKKELAIEYYSESIQYNPLNKKALLSLSKYHIHHHEYAAAQTQLATLLRADENNQEASLLIGQILTDQNQLDQATFHFRQILEKQLKGLQIQWQLMASYVDLSCRIAKLGEAEDLLRLIADNGTQKNFPAGFYYCQGLYHRYSHDVSSAIKAFHQARKDSEFGTLATIHLIELFLNPDNETMGGEAFGIVEKPTEQRKGDTNSNLTGSSDITTDDAQVVTIQDLPLPKTLRHQVLEASMHYIGKRKSDIDKGISVIQELLEREPDYIPALLAISEGYMLNKLTSRAKTYLKRLARAEWSSEFADDLEKAWILLADSYIQIDKFDTAKVFLQSCLDHNKSCSKAWEYTGLIHEKASEYKQACDSYRRAWDIDTKQQAKATASTSTKDGTPWRGTLTVGPGGHWRAAAPSYPSVYNSEVGYKLAYNYLRTNRLLDAISICHMVLKQAPDNPRLRKEVLEKARAGLRP